MSSMLEHSYVFAVEYTVSHPGVTTQAFVEQFRTESLRSRFIDLISENTNEMGVLVRVIRTFENHDGREIGVVSFPQDNYQYGVEYAFGVKGQDTRIYRRYFAREVTQEEFLQSLKIANSTGVATAVVIRVTREGAF